MKRIIAGLVALSLVAFGGQAAKADRFEDILKNGRKSEYWPAAYKTGAASAAIEPLLLRALSGAYNAPEGASKAQTALAVLEALLAGGK